MEQMPRSDAEQHLEAYREFTEAIRRQRPLPRLQLPAAARCRDYRARARRPDLGHRRTLGRDQGATRGYYLIEARDLNEAIQVAARIPGARFGCVEVRRLRTIRRRCTHWVSTRRASSC